MKILLSGLTGAGKSTLGRRLAEHYGIPYISGGNALKRLIAGDETAGDVGWWERKGGARALELRKSDPSFDEKIDEELLRLAEEKGSLVIDSWTLPHLLKCPDCICIFLKASLEERSIRIMKRDQLALREAAESVRRKDQESMEIYQEIYGFRLGEDLSPFHLVLDNTNLSSEETFEIALRFVEAWSKGWDHQACS